jgi:hypothetical protein
VQASWTTNRRATLGASAVVITALLASCGDGDGTSAGSSAGTTTGSEDPARVAEVAEGAGAPVIDPGDGGVWAPELDPADFVETIDNPYLPFTPGSRWVYEGETDEGHERIEVVVTGERREILGISAVVVRDTVHVDGELVEDTFDWFAQDVDGTVWYLGEDSREYEDGDLVGREGSWEAGVDGAVPGIVMPAQPAVGDAYRQELLPGEAEDLGEVVEVGGRVVVPAGAFDGVVTTRDWNPLEPEVVEEKQYAPGIGLVREEHVRGGDAVIELVEFRSGA